MENGRKTKGADKGGERRDGMRRKTRESDGIVSVNAASSFPAKLLYQLILFLGFTNRADNY